MRRRDFITLLGGAVASALPCRAHAQPAQKMTIGFLGETGPAILGRRVAAFVHRLSEHGWIDGRNVAIDLRWADARDDHMVAIASDFVRLNVDVIVTSGTPPVLAARRATSTIPIVSALMGDPIGTGLVNSLGRPGGNVTGLSTQAADTAGKRVELMRELLPQMRRLAILANVGNPLAAIELGRASAAAATFGLGVAVAGVAEKGDIAPALEAIRDEADAMYVVTDTLTGGNRPHINALALRLGLPTVYNVRESIETGGLMSYGPNFTDLFRRAADYVDKILRGAKPGDLPVEQPTKFDLVVNLKIAKALGLAIPESFLLRADEVIE